MKNLQKKISWNQSESCLVNPVCSLTSFSDRLVQPLESSSFKRSIIVCLSKPINFVIFFCLHSNLIKATSLINVYEKISPQRRYNQLSFFEWCFESPENKTYQNQNMATCFTGVTK